jgi:hypothetical protein
MPTTNAGDWRELFDVALFEPNRVRLRQRIEHAKHAIHNRLDSLMDSQVMSDQGENRRIVAERIALSDALTTLAELHKIVYSRKSSPSAKRQDDRAAGQGDLR